MANVKIKLDTRRAKSDGTYNIIYKIRHLKKVYTINSGITMLEQYWDYSNSKVNTEYPNAKLINLKLLNDYLQIEKAILTLDDDFTIEKLRSIIKGKLSDGSTFSVFQDDKIDIDATYYHNALYQDFGWSLDGDTWTGSVYNRRAKLGQIYINPRRRVAIYYYPRGTFAAFKVNINN